MTVARTSGSGQPVTNQCFLDTRQNCALRTQHDRSCCANMQGQCGADERRRVRRAANQRFLGAMLDMGIAQDHAELALAETGNVGIEASAPFHVEHPQERLAETGNVGIEASARFHVEHPQEGRKRRWTTYVLRVLDMGIAQSWRSWRRGIRAS